MNNSGAGGGFLSGYRDDFLGINRNQQQNPGGLLGVNRNQLQNQVSNGSACVQNDDVGSLLMNMNSAAETDRTIGLRKVKDWSPGGYTMSFGKEKILGPNKIPTNSTINFNDDLSDEDDRSFEEGNVGDTSGAKGKKDKDAPWQRMKWTDDVVRLLIQVVASVGEDCSSEGSDGMRRKSGIIKKGKWKKVSKILISKGYQVSPQQCEDKFNDLNKRYKKLNDILGTGTSCQVVENPGLLENMQHLSAKAKEDVKKLLVSKHLFYREICAYHNGEKITGCCDLELPVHPNSAPEEILNNHDGSPVAANCSKDKDGSHFEAHCSKDNKVSEEEDAEESDESEDDVSDNEADNHASGSVEKMGVYEDRERANGDFGNTRLQFSRLENFQAEMVAFFNDPTKSQWERKEWIRKRVLQVEEERIGIQAEALELEKQRLKWRRFCNKKEFELETARLEKEGLILENEQKSLQLKHKDWT